MKGRLDPRQPLPAGHPLTWKLLTDGTVLDGEPYPHPVFDDISRPPHRPSLLGASR